MRTIPLLCSIFISAGLANFARAVPDSFIHLDVSVKFIVNPATGQAPAGTDDANLRQTFDHMNRWLANTWRGYRLRLVDLDASLNFKRIGGLSDTTGPGKWYNSDFKNDESLNHAFEDAAKAEAVLYGWNFSAINMYVNNGAWSSAQFPSGGWALVQTGYGLISNNVAPESYQTNNYKIAGNLLHEVGHFFELYHTFGGGSDDGIADTAPDILNRTGRNETTIRNDLAQLTWAVNYSALTAPQKILVDNTANNAMSYYQLFYDDPEQDKELTDAERFGPTRFVFTEQQMDKWADYANLQRAAVASGTMRFVQANAASTGIGTSTSPHKTLALGIGAASSTGSDILILRPGTYTATTLTKPMTIRATREWPVTIQIP